MVSETEGGTEGTEEESTGEVAPPEEVMTEAVPTPEAEAPAPAKPKKVGGRRAALRIIRENVESLSKDVGIFRKSHEASAKRLEKQVASLRNELAALKSHIAKEGARARAKQDVTLSKILAKVSIKPAAKPAAKPAGVSKKKSKPKGKKK